MSTKKKFYCGDKKKLPDGYDDFGTRFQCLKRGVGVGMSIERGKHTDVLSMYEIKRLAERLKISLTHRKVKKSREQLLDEIAEKIDKQVVQDE